jgi:hypothetical protein
VVIKLADENSIEYIDLKNVKQTAATMSDIVSHFKKTWYE